MLFDPTILVRETWPVLATFIIIVVGKSLAALGIVLAFRHALGTAMTISASLAQIGEFSFILAGLGVALGLMPQEGRDLILAGALLSILFNPLLFMALDRFAPLLEKYDPIRAGGASTEATPEPAPIEITDQTGHAVLVGFGRVGGRIGEALLNLGTPLFVIDEKDAIVAGLAARNIRAIAGNATTMLRAANLAPARSLFVAIPDSFEAGQIVDQARAANSALEIIAWAHSDAEAKYLTDYGANEVILGAEEIADAMVARYLAP
jgi:CPA2 family monovalent cation:H+ antiporter-2